MSSYTTVLFSHRNAYAIIVFHKLVHEVGPISKNITGPDLTKLVYTMHLGLDKLRWWSDL